jgi:hypothetical protein
MKGPRPITRKDLRRGLGSLPKRPKNQKHVDPRTPEETAHMTPEAIYFSKPNKSLGEKFVNNFILFPGMVAVMIVLFQWGEAFRLLKGESLGYEGGRGGQAMQQVLDHNPLSTASKLDADLYRSDYLHPTAERDRDSQQG